VGVLRHPATLIRVEKDVVDVQRRGNQRLVVGSGDFRRTADYIRQIAHGPQALINRADIQIDFNLVVLQGNQRQSKTRVAAIPELKRHIEGRFREGIARGANLRVRPRGTRTIDVAERGIRDEGELSSITHHLEVTTLLFLGERELVPDVHPVTILPINALTTDLHLHLRDHLFTGEVQPAGIDTLRQSTSCTTIGHLLVNFRERHLQVSAVRQITIATDRARDTATEIRLSVERLFDRLHRKVGVTTIRHLPEGNLRVSRQVHVLSAISYELHKSSSHCYIIAKENKFEIKQLNR